MNKSRHPYIAKFPTEEYCKENCPIGKTNGWCSWVENTFNYEATVGYMLDEKCPKVARTVDLIMDNANLQNKLPKNPSNLLTLS